MDNNLNDFQKEAVEYLGLLEELGIKDMDTSVNKKRTHRRFLFDSPDKTILLQIGDDMCSLYDVSVGGLSFISRNEYESGKKLELNFDGRFQVEVEIINAFLEKETSNEENHIFRHGTRFIQKSDGYKCTISVLKYFVEIMKAKL